MIALQSRGEGATLTGSNQEPPSARHRPRARGFPYLIPLALPRSQRVCLVFLLTDKENETQRGSVTYPGYSVGK